MSSKILIKRSTTTGAVPSTSDLDTGELAINTVDKKLYTNNSGTIVEIGVLPSAIDVTNNATVGGTLAVTGNTTLSTGSTTGDFSVAGSLTLSTEGTLDSHVVTKGYVDTAISDVLDSAPAALDTLNELAAAINDDANFAATITTALATKLPLAGGTMTGDIVMGSNAVTSTANPTTDDELARKGYVDTILGSATDAATSASEAATSASNAANSASSASTSETNAAASEGNAASSATAAAASASAASSSASSASSSASAAATSAASASTSASSAESAWDSLDDRYLGAKASDPTTDNDGNALLTGAMYFDSTNNVTKVYNGTDWQAASSSIEGIKSDFQYTATASQTVFSGNDDNTNELVIDKAGLTNVFLNGVRLVDSDYTVDVGANSVTLASGAALNDIVEIEVFGNFAGQSGADVAITGGSITGLTELSTGTFTSTGIDDNATSTAITIDSSENVLVGTTDDVPWNNTGDNTGHALREDGRAGFSYYNATANANATVNINRTGSDGDVARFFKDGSTVGSIGNIFSDLVIGTDDTGLQFRSFRDAVVPFNIGTAASSDGVISLGWSGNSFKDLYLSGGVYLGGTGSANKLDDYETGSWTPTISSLSSGAVSLTEARYTKIGRIVHAAIKLNVDSAISSGVGYLVFTVPFTQYASETIDTGTITLYPSQGRDSGIVINNSGTNSTQFYAGWTLTSNKSAGTDIRISLTYETNQ